MAKSHAFVLNGSGLIGSAIVRDLRQRGVPVVAIARRFGPAERVFLDGQAVETQFVDASAGALAELFVGRVDVVVNCVGVLQDSPSGSTKEAHVEFVHRLIPALRVCWTWAR